MTANYGLLLLPWGTLEDGSGQQSRWPSPLPESQIKPPPASPSSLSWGLGDPCGG